MYRDCYSVLGKPEARLTLSSSMEGLQTPWPSLESANTLKTFNTIRDTFDRVCGHVVFNKNLAKEIVKFQVAFMNKNEDHIAFFGGVLTGVHVVRFTTTDMNRLFSDILEINELELEDELHQLKAIVADRKVSGDVFNHVCLWMVHKFMTSEHLDKETRVIAARAAAVILNYRYLTSLLAWYYKFPANPEDAQAAYSRLTKKSAIKQYGSWQALLEARTQDFFPPDGLHSKTIVDYIDDYGIVYALNDSQGRIRSMMKHLMGELIAAKNAGARVRSVSATVELDGESFLRDTVAGLNSYTTYLFSVLPDEHAFVKDEIIGVITEALHTAPPNYVRDTLRWISANYKTSRGKNIDPLITEVLLHSFNYLEDNRNVARETTNIAAFIMRLKGVYMSSRSTDPQLMRIRDLSEGITTNAVATRNPAVISAVKTAVMLYIVVRAFSKNHYTK